MAPKTKYPIRKTSPFQTRVSKSSGLSPLRQDTESEQGLLASATETLRRNLAENLNPYSYSDPLGRIYKAGVKGEKDPKRERTEVYEEGEKDQDYFNAYGGEKSFESAERVDLLNITMGQPQKYNSMQESEYRPTESKDSDATYYRSKQTELEIIRAVNIEKRGTGIVEGVDKVLSGGSRGEAGRRGGSVLGKYKIDKGVDKKGHYISYYDIWDLNPIPESGVDFIDTGVGKVASYLTKKAGLKSPEIYGRIYYDPKTGKFIE